MSERTLDVAGVISGTGGAAQEIIATSENGFPWQASLGATTEKVIFVTDGKTANANGREFTGPVYIARKSMLGEVSLVPLGADDDTFAYVAAAVGSNNNVEATTMEFEQWASDSGLEIESMDEANLAGLKAMFQKQQQPLPEPSKPATNSADPTPDPAADMRAKAAAESRRIAAVRKVCNGKHADLEAKAIEEGWDETKAELAVLRASRLATPSIVTLRNDAPLAAVLEVVACMADKLPGLDDLFGEDVLQAAHDQFQGSISLPEHLLGTQMYNSTIGLVGQSSPIGSTKPSVDSI